MLKGIIPIVFTPFTPSGHVDEAGLKRIVRFELDGGVDGIGINGFASEAYKLSDAERLKNIEIVAAEISESVPLIIGIAPPSTEAGIEQVKMAAKFKPAALMTLPPSTMDNGDSALIEHYVALGQASDVPIMVQQSPHIPAYSHTALSADSLALINQRAPMVSYFKIEGGGSAEKIAALRPLVGEDVGIFGGGGGITLLSELRAGASGLIPGVGFNDYFVEAWKAWKAGDEAKAQAIIEIVQPLVTAVSGKGHEYSLHARKVLMQHAGYIEDAYVRRPTCEFRESDMSAIIASAATLELRIHASKEKKS